MTASRAPGAQTITGQVAPCDCGRDSRVAQLLGIIASEWEGEP